MYFDPLSAWLVTLIAEGFDLLGEKSNTGSISEYYQKNVKLRNEMLNAEIRKIKEKYGLTLATMAYEQIQFHIGVTKNSYSFQNEYGQIVLDIDNQEYIIAVLEECAKYYSQYKTVEEYQEKVEWYKKAAIEARRKKEEYAKELEELRIREAETAEKERAMSDIYLCVGIIICIAFIIFLFS